MTKRAPSFPYLTDEYEPTNTDLWEKVKEFIGVKSLADIPGRVKELAKEGYAALKKVLTRVFKTWPLKLYTLPENALFSVNKILENLLVRFPQFGKWLEASVKPRVDQFDKWLSEHLPVVRRVLMTAIYVWIWLNVVEFEWDLKGAGGDPIPSGLYFIRLAGAGVRRLNVVR